MPSDEPAGDKKKRPVIHAGGNIDRFSLGLAFHGPDLEPDEISSALGCAPTSAHRRGEPKRSRNPDAAPWPAGAWLLSVDGEAPTSIKESLAQLLSRLPADAAIWRDLTSRYRGVLNIGLFVDSWNRGFGLEPGLVSQLALMGIELNFDIYCDADDNPDPAKSRASTKPDAA